MGANDCWICPSCSKAEATFWTRTFVFGILSASYLKDDKFVVSEGGPGQGGSHEFHPKFWANFKAYYCISIWDEIPLT